jgi:hypothetical protein
MNSRLPGVLLCVALVLGLLSGCVRIPTSGPVIAGNGPSQLPEVSVEVAPEPPNPGASPRAVVEGFLQAMANYQPGYAVARLYLAADVRDSWRPDLGVTVYDDGYGISSAAETVLLEAPVVGRIEADGSFTHSAETLRHEFGMARDAEGEWRITNPPSGLLISRYLFDKFYESTNIYFFDPSWTAIVADPVFLPSGNQTPTALLQALLRGPTEWLAPVVVTAAPTQTRLNVQSAFIDPAGVVEVSLNETIAALSDEQRSRLAAQLTWTLDQLPGVTGVRLLMNGSPYAVPEAEQGVVRVEAYGWLNPIPAARTMTAYGATEDGLVRLADSARGAELESVPGPWGGTGGVSAIAVNATRDRVAVVTDDRTMVLTGPLEGGIEQTVAGRNVLRPQFVRSREPELWTVLDAPAGGQVQVAHRIVNGTIQTVPLAAFETSRVVAYRISPDATRMAAIRRNADGRMELGLARINRSLPEIIVDGWRTLPLGDDTEPGPEALVDVGWLDATTLLVLAGEDERQPVKPYRLDEYAAEVVEIGQPDDWQAYEVATAPRAGSGAALVIGRNGVWRYESDYRWPLVTRGVITATFAG